MASAIPVAGFTVKDITIKPGKSQEGDDDGTIKVVLEASKGDLVASDYNFSDMLAALNLAQSHQSTVALQLLFPES